MLLFKITQQIPSREAAIEGFYRRHCLYRIEDDFPLHNFQAELSARR
jgi:hypothetical protein